MKIRFHWCNKVHTSIPRYYNIFHTVNRIKYRTVGKVKTNSLTSQIESDRQRVVFVSIFS
jgi:hypothetical protein